MRRAAADDALFLAGGVAFNVLLAGIPFILLLAAGLGFVLNESPDAAVRIVQTAVANLLPSRTIAENSILDPVIADMIRTRLAVGFGGALAFAWFASRLFATLRSVLAFIFMNGRERGYLRGMLLDLNLIALSLVLMTFWVTISAWLVVSSGQVGAALAATGVLDGATSGLVYAVGRVSALGLVVLIFAALYRWLPRRRLAIRPTLVGALSATGLFEVARWVFAELMPQFWPSSIYTGSLGAIFIVIFWTYYAALIFVLGAEVAHVVEMRLIASGALPQRDSLSADFGTTREARAATLIDSDSDITPPSTE